VGSLAAFASDFVLAFFLFFDFPAAFAASFAAFNRTGLTCCRIRSKTSAGSSSESLDMIRFVNACNILKGGASCVRATSPMSHLTTSLRLMIQRISASVLTRAKMRTYSATEFTPVLRGVDRGVFVCSTGGGVLGGGNDGLIAGTGEFNLGLRFGPRQERTWKGNG